MLEVLQPKVPVQRMVFHEITPHAIREALDNPRELDMKLVEAQEGRRILDRLVGWETSPVLWRVFGRGQAASAGRVQSVAVRMVVRARARAHAFPRRAVERPRSRARRARSSRSAPSLVELDGKRVAEGRDFDPDDRRDRRGRAPTTSCCSTRDARASARRPAARRRRSRVTSVESDPFTERPRAPFTTSTLQQESGRKLRFGAARTMSIAQRLYERGYITYMRTDSTNLSEQAITAARTAIREQYGEEYLPAEPRAYRSKVKNAQEAHEAIRPAGDRIRTPDAVRAELDADEQRLYELIWIRTVACQMADARGSKMTIRVARDLDRERDARRSAPSGKTYDFLGWRRVYVEDVDEGEELENEARLPAVVEGERVACTELAPVAHETKPPARYTEASLVKELEERGIGRPSTYAAVIETIQARGYVWRKGTALVPAWTAFAVTNLLEQHFGHLVDYGFTATMEEALDVIARGEGEAEKWLHSFYFGNGTPGLRELVSDEQLAHDRPARREHDPDRHRRHRPRARRARRPVRARTCSAKTTRPRRCRPTSRPTSSRSSSRSSSSPSRRRARSRSAPIPRPDLAGVRAHRPVRPVRAARRAGRRHEEEAEALVAVRDARRPRRSRSTKRCSCCRCRASSAPTPRSARSSRRRAASVRT